LLPQRRMDAVLLVARVLACVRCLPLWFVPAYLPLPYAAAGLLYNGFGFALPDALAAACTVPACCYLCTVLPRLATVNTTLSSALLAAARSRAHARLTSPPARLDCNAGPRHYRNTSH